MAAAVTAAVLALDQLTKWWAVRALDDEVIRVAWTLQLRLIYNTGGSFSIGTGYGRFIGLIVIAVVAVLVWIARGVTRTSAAVAVGLVLGGALGNLGDRAFRGDSGFLGGAVVDFIDLQWWPAFNLADAAVVVGGILLFLTGARPDRPSNPARAR